MTRIDLDPEARAIAWERAEQRSVPGRLDRPSDPLAAAQCAVRADPTSILDDPDEALAAAVQRHTRPGLAPSPDLRDVMAVFEELWGRSCDRDRRAL